MKKVYNILLILLGIFVLYVLILLVPGKDIFGGFRTLEEARAAVYKEYIGYYDQEALVHTEETTMRYTDFVVRNDTLHIIIFKKRSTLVGEKYTSRSRSSYYNFTEVVESDSIAFKDSGKLDLSRDAGFEPFEYLFEVKSSEEKRIKWTVLTADCNVTNDGVCVYPFSYAGVDYILCIVLDELE